MKHRKITWAVLGMLWMMLAIIPAKPVRAGYFPIDNNTFYQTPDNNWTYYFSSGDLIIQRYDDRAGAEGMTTLEIPESIEGKPVIGIQNIFSFLEPNTTITKLVIPASVKVIQPEVLSGFTSLKELQIPSGNKHLKAQNGVLLSKNGKKLISIAPGAGETLTVPDGVTTIGERCLYNNETIKKIILPASVVKVEDYAFNCALNVKSIILQDGVKSVGDMSFYACTSLKSLTFGKGLKTIGSQALDHCNCLKDVTIPGTVTDVGHIDDYSYTRDFTFHLPKGSVSENTVKKAEFHYDYKGAAAGPKKGTSFTASKLKVKVTGSNTATVTAPSSKTVSSVTVPKTVTTEDGFVYKITAIGNNAFKKCSKLATVKIDDNVKEIGSSAFAGCKALTKVSIGKNVTKIGVSAFSGDQKLKTITITSSSLKTVGKNALKGIHASAKIKVPAAKLADYKKLLKSKGQGKNVSIIK